MTKSAAIDLLAINMSAAIKLACGSTVEFTCRDAETCAWTVSGENADVLAARDVMLGAGLTLDHTHYDDRPDAYGDIDTTRYDYWIRAT